MSIGQKIRLERQRFGMSVKYLAYAADIDHRTVWAFERDKISPRLCTATRIAEAFGLTVSELIGQTAPVLTDQERRVIAAMRGNK